MPGVFSSVAPVPPWRADPVNGRGKGPCTLKIRPGPGEGSPETARAPCASCHPVLASLLRSLSSAEASFWVYRRSLRAFRPAFSRPRATVGSRSRPSSVGVYRIFFSGVKSHPSSSVVYRPLFCSARTPCRASWAGGDPPDLAPPEPSRREELAGTLGASVGKPPDPPRPGGSERSSEASTGRPEADEERAASRKPLPPAGRALGVDGSLPLPRRPARGPGATEEKTPGTGPGATGEKRRPPWGDGRYGRKDGRRGGAGVMGEKTLATGGRALWKRAVLTRLPVR